RAGTSGRDAISQGLIAKSTTPRRTLAEGAVTSLDQIQDKVADVDILKGEQILAARFVSAQDASALPIPPEMQAVSVEVGIPPGVAGFIQQGSRVSIVAQVAATGQGSSDARVQYLLQDVQVLNIGQRVVATQQQGAGANGQVQASDASKVLLTLALAPKDVEKLSYAIWNGQLYFTLLPPDQKPVNTPGRTSANIFQP
ncbi:MAG: Flp pilus assembly protein CpaB, partial [Actinomycetota bacterium]|nr:Flp pilus assembly protein CpaB [Actinomycetota bacterium]